MKQHITIDQLNELSPKAKEILDAWYSKQPYEYAVVSVEQTGITVIKETNPLLSIGQMIELLDENDLLETETGFDKGFSWTIDTNPCDLLWESVKQILETE